MKSKYLLVLVIGLLAAGCNTAPSDQSLQLPSLGEIATRQVQNGQTQIINTSSPISASQTSAQGAKDTSNSNTIQLSTQAQAQTSTVDPLAGLGSNKYASGVLPLGDYKYVTDAPKKGYVYLCRAQTGGGGAQENGSWINGNTWNINTKTSVQGDVVRMNAGFSIIVSGSNRIITTNDLPTNHTVGTFPVSSSDPAYQIDRNPNTITAQNFTFTLPLNPTMSSTPNCMGGEVGVMTNGVVLFNAFDAEGRDAAAHEVQDHCQAHPQESGIYHYHSLSSCIPNATVTNVIGFAFDGLPITGPEISTGRYLTTDDLDECHGITSSIMLDGKMVTAYHYVMTEDFPYSVSCFRAKNSQTGPLGGAAGSSQSQSSSGLQSQTGQNSGTQNGPPQAAISACSGQTSGSSCSFTTQQGNSITGTCQTPPNSSLACVPAGGPPQ